jgi:hypothetical protein
MLKDITPVLLTYNEAPNIGRTLAQLNWAKDIVILDSHSTDETKAIAQRNPRVRWFERAFDTHADQWEFAVRQTNVRTGWVLALDADYVLTDGLVAELAALRVREDVAAYEVRFRYCSLGRPLRGSLYPPVKALFRLALAFYAQDGHAQRLITHGRVEMLKHRILHDDRKSLTRWLASQRKYALLEAEKLAQTPLSALSFPDKIRSVPFLSAAPVFAHSMVLKGCALDGVPGAFYAAQRVAAEIIVSAALVERYFKG